MHLILAVLATVSVLLYSHYFQQQGRMMVFLSLQSLLVPLFKHKFCTQIVEGQEKTSINSKPLLLALPLLTASLYAVDGLSGLTSGVLFLIVLPEVTQRLPSRFFDWRNLLFYTLVVCLCAPVGLLVYVAVYHEQEVLQAPEEYLTFAKKVLGARPETVPDYYAVVGVRRGADTAEIKRVFREASKLYHPDKTAGDVALQEKFVAITEAVRKLTGKKTDREAYMRELQQAEMQDMVTRSVYFAMLFALWLGLNLLNALSRPRVPAAGSPEEAAALAALDDNPKPVKPARPLTRTQIIYLTLSVPAVLAWLAVEAVYADDAPPLADYV
eukprot:CAMPEP_0113693244 /NCGR_PEP_ID=MMETSP0038_2-20120614/19556_1 /TAXON_ID=2898 /ORGANISM="Cryptomonas paramecium" /LENGTH=326 /DNA_ID=CAMNT_0000615293 /DNA_START=233 /DNA_END=1211 /DNA_ORIENTATION=- /assembly_acc=CAM_ASM_000170